MKRRGKSEWFLSFLFDQQGFGQVVYRQSEEICLGLLEGAGGSLSWVVFPRLPCCEFLNHLSSSANQQDFSSGKSEDWGTDQEKPTKSLVIGPFAFHLDSSAVHRIFKMVVCALEHEYEPYSRLKPGLFLA